MTDRATFEALLARVLEGEKPDRELDAEIGAAFRVLPTNSVGPNVLGWLRRWEGPFVTDPALPGHILTENRINWKAPPYTESLDAVLRDLLPEGWGWAISTTGDLMPCAYGHSLIGLFGWMTQKPLRLLARFALLRCALEFG